MDTIQFILPEYCDFYKNILVEELVYIINPVKLHYGKCAVIGKLLCEERKYYLQNIRLKCLNETYQLPTGSVRTLLLPSTDQNSFPTNTFAEVFGEAVLWDTTNIDQIAVQVDRNLPAKSKDLMQFMCDKQLQLEREKGDDQQRKPTGMCDKSMNSTVRMALRRELDELKRRYIPAIRVHKVNVIDQAEELIECHLEMRLVQQMKKLKN